MRVSLPVATVLMFVASDPFPGRACQEQRVLISDAFMWERRKLAFHLSEQEV